MDIVNISPREQVLAAVNVRLQQENAELITERDKAQRMFLTAYTTLDAVGKILGCDLEKDGPAPIILALLKLKETPTKLPVAIVTVDGTLGVDFTKASNYGMDLPIGTELYTK